MSIPGGAARSPNYNSNVGCGRGGARPARRQRGFREPPLRVGGGWSKHEILPMKSEAPPAPVADADGAKTPRRAQTRQALMDAAAKLFAERGYHKTTVPSIVREAGVSQGTFYQYFGNRRDVLLAITQVAHEPSRQRRPIYASFPDLMRENINWYMIESMRYTTLSKVWHDAAAHDPEIASMVRQAHQERSKEFAASIAALDAAGTLIPEVAATAIVAMIDEFTFRWLVDHEGPPRSTADVLAASETLFRLISRALDLQPAPAVAG